MATLKVREPMKILSLFGRIFAVFLILLVALSIKGFAQDTDMARGPVFKQGELDQMAAPIALYPDALLSQVLIASTYPIEVVQADRWANQNKGLAGDALAQALEAQHWDPSVKSLVNFPQVLEIRSICGA